MVRLIDDFDLLSIHSASTITLRSYQIYGYKQEDLGQRPSKARAEAQHLKNYESVVFSLKFDENLTSLDG